MLENQAMENVSFGRNCFLKYLELALKIFVCFMICRKECEAAYEHK